MSEVKTSNDTDKSADKPTKPWTGTATRTDKFLITAPFVIMAIMLALKPLSPFLLAHHPEVLAAITGSTSSIVAAAAFAKVNSTSILIPILCGVFGSIKFSWLFWWAGRRWGKNIIDMVTPSDKLKAKLYAWRHKRWIGRVGVLFNELPGVPSLIMVLFAGYQRMSFWTFMALNAVAALAWVGFVTWVGYSLGQTVVDAVLWVDSNAVWVSLAIVFGLAFFGARKNKKAAARR